MSNVAHYLQEHLVGEVLTAHDVRTYFSTDGSVLTVRPSVVVYPRNENDVRKAARFSWQLAERGRNIPITARGLGTDQSGAAIGQGMIMVFPAHLNRILELDSKTGLVSVEPGINYGKLQQTLHTHGRFLPPYPSAIDSSTIGGAIANNSAGEKALKYGNTRQYVKSLRVVLANGEVIETGRINKRELDKKMGLATFEGEIYRAMDKLLEEQGNVLQSSPLGAVTKNAAGYDVWSIRRKDGSVDLTPLFVGSQGTLGIITEATLSTEPYNPNTTLIAAFMDDTQVAEQIITELRNLPALPSAIEMVDEYLLKFVEQQNPNLLKGVIPQPLSKLVLLIEFDETNQRLQKKLVKKTTKLLDQYNVNYQVETEERLKDSLWKIRHAASLYVTHNEGNGKPVPIIEDGVVPIDRFNEYLTGVYGLFQKYHLPAAVWGHAGNAHLHIMPFLDLAQVGDRQKVFRLMDEYYQLVISLGGTTSGENSDGRIRAPYLAQLYGAEVYEVFRKTKHIFDPYGLLNPGVKIDVNLETIKPLLRNEYSLKHGYDHLPRG